MNIAQINLKISNDKTQHVCETCGKNFKFKFRHKRIHSGVKPYGRGISNMNFAEKGNLTQHQLTHSGLKNCE